MTTIKVGIIGAGQIAQLHADGYKEDDRAVIQAVCDVREDTAISKALQWGSQVCHTNYRAILADPDIDAVDILTPHHLHAPMILEALAAGKHVMVQRPLALTVADADRIIAEARKRNLTLCVAEPLLSHAPLLDARSYLEAGEIGEPVGIRVKVGVGAPEGGWKVRPESWLWRFDPKKCGGGPFLFDGIYGALVSATHLLDKVDQLSAWIGRTEIYPGYFVDAPASVMWRHRWRNCPGTLELTYSPEMYIRSSHYPTDTRIELTGTKGIIWLRTSPANVTMSAPVQMYRDGRLFSFGEVQEDWAQNFKATTRNFIDAIFGSAEPQCSAEQGRQLLRLAIAARDSSATERIQKFN